MFGKLIKKIWLIYLCLASLTLVGCFHVPDEDWLPNKNKVSTWNTQKDDEMEQALSSFMSWIDIISSQRNEMKNGENYETVESAEWWDTDTTTANNENQESNILN